jgi:hypothetical protein
VTDAEHAGCVSAFYDVHAGGDLASAAFSRRLCPVHT